MSFYILRNSTIENLFGSKEITYSGYNDISYVNHRADIIIWFYLLPIKADNKLIVQEIESYSNSLKFVLQQISTNKTFLIFTLSAKFLTKIQSSDFSIELAISDYNKQLVSISSQYSNVKIIDIDEFTNKYTLDQLIDWKYYFISKMQINPRLASSFKNWFNLKLNEIKLLRKKCLVLDLDNTLWGGVAGEDGIHNIKVGGDYPGNAYLYFQEHLIELSKNGIILTVCSKNNIQDVLEVWNKNPYNLLNNQHLSAYRINWQNKASNIRELAEELNIGLDSLVFIDDNPTERELVKQMLPMVEVPDFPEQPYMLPSFITYLTNNYFRTYTITEEDRQKTIQYKANSERINAKESFSDFSDYLKSLKIDIRIEPINSYSTARLAQMTQKTNQFNLTTRRYTDNDLMSLWDKGCLIYSLSVKDKFGDNGITGLIIIKTNLNKKSAYIDSFLLSCRILGKGIEKAFIYSVLQKLKNEGYETLKATYLPTAKNEQVRNFYDSINFNIINTNESINGEKSYIINLNANEFKIESYYKIEEV